VDDLIDEVHALAPVRTSRRTGIPADAPRRLSPDERRPAHMVRQALLALSPEHRSVIVEVYWRRRSLAEAATILRLPETTVARHAYDAVRCLRAAARDHGR
jgi:RNA polymerase sigma-70 factor, ECF subfamily